MKVGERIFENKIQQQIKTNDMKFGFTTGKGTTDAIFILRQMQDNFIVKGNKLHFCTVDLEKPFDSNILREVIRCGQCVG